MTRAEYERLYRAARESWPRLTIESMRGMQRVYDQAVNMVTEVIRQAELKGYAEITQASWAQIEAQLEAGAKLIREALEKQATRAITTGTERLTGIDARYLIDVTPFTDGRITAAGVKNMYVAINQTLISTLASRIYQGKYTFSERVWRVGYGYSTKIKDLVGAGLAGNMDVRDIARVIEQYVKKGAQSAATRYGGLMGKEFRRRMGKDVSYPALRLVRSELYASMQQTALWSGRVNPGALDLYDWIRSTHEDWNCSCPELAENSPYTYQSAPSYPHSQCLCRLVPRLMDRRQFVDDLKRWGNGEPVEYLDNWKTSYYDQMS